MTAVRKDSLGGWLALGALAALAGCETLPTVNYHHLSDPGKREGWTPFRLTDSTIVLGAPASPASFDPDADKGETFTPPVTLAATPVDCEATGCGAVVAVAAPIGYEGEVLAIEAHSHRLVSTTLSPVYVANSLRLKQLTIEAKDHRLEAINTLGALASGAAKIGAGRSARDVKAETEKPKPLAQLHLPVTIDLAAAKCADGAGPGCVAAVTLDAARSLPPSAARALPENPGWTYTLAFLDDPRTAGFLARGAVAGVHTAMVSSLCRPVRVELVWTKGGVPPVDLSLSVADPDWLSTTPFPSKGAMVFHSLCGVDVQPQAVTTVGVDTLATAFFNNVAAVRGAQKK